MRPVSPLPLLCPPSQRYNNIFDHVSKNQPYMYVGEINHNDFQHIHVHGTVCFTLEGSLTIVELSVFTPPSPSLSLSLSLSLPPSQVEAKQEPLSPVVSPPPPPPYTDIVVTPSPPPLPPHEPRSPDVSSPPPPPPPQSIPSPPPSAEKQVMSLTHV